jgi:adenylate cyclase
MIEIEYKYLVSSIPDGYLSSKKIVQGYLDTLTGEARVVITDGKKGYLCIKKPKTDAVEGLPSERFEVEVSIPLELAQHLMASTNGSLEKTRHFYESGWEFDYYHGSLEGLIVAEVELKHKDDSIPELPEGAGFIRDITHDNSYRNKSLAQIGRELAV